jgi:hypothetical protein
METRGRARCAGATIVAALLALVWGSAAYAVTGTVKVLLSPGLDVTSPLSLLAAPPLIAMEGMLWGLLGGAMFMLPPAILLFAALAARTAPGRRATRTKAVAVAAAVFLPPYVVGLRGYLVDGALLAFSVWFGVRAGLRDLERRLAVP